MEKDDAVRDIPPAVRTYLNRICYDDLKTQPFTEVVQKSGMPEPFYRQAQKQIYGDRQMTPGMLLRICKLLGDFTPLVMCGEEIGIAITVEQPRMHSDDEVRELLEANAAMGELNGELTKALTEGHKLSKAELIALLSKCSSATNELKDVHAVLSKKAGGAK